MKFLCLIHYDEEARDAMPAEQWEALMDACFAEGDALQARGVMLAGAALQPARTAVIVRRKRGDRSFTDGPFVETKEQLAGYLLLEAPDVEAAKAIALSLRVGVLGTLELRAVWEPEDLLMRRVTAGERTENAVPTAMPPQYRRTHE